MHGGQTARRLEHPQNTPERGPTIEALAHQAHVSAAWLGEAREFEAEGNRRSGASQRARTVAAYGAFLERLAELGARPVSLASRLTVPVLAAPGVGPVSLASGLSAQV